MHLNTIAPAPGSKKNAKRLGRGIGSGKGKTAGKGHKGQRARAGGYHKLGFEGGQMPLHRRLPKFGFTPIVKTDAMELRLSSLNKLKTNEVSLAMLREAGLIPNQVKTVKIILNGEINKSYSVASDVRVTKGAKAAILAAGGKVD